MMKRIFTFLAFCLLCIGAQHSIAQTYGPDAYGYTADPTTFSWVDITTKPGAVNITSGMADDNSVGPYAMGFDFRYYWDRLQ